MFCAGYFAGRLAPRRAIGRARDCKQVPCGGVGRTAPTRRLEAGRGGLAGERYSGTFSQMRGSGAATDFFLGGSLAPIGVTVRSSQQRRG